MLGFAMVIILIVVCTVVGVDVGLSWWCSLLLCVCGVQFIQFTLSPKYCLNNYIMYSINPATSTCLCARVCMQLTHTYILTYIHNSTCVFVVSLMNVDSIYLLVHASY